MTKGLLPQPEEILRKIQNWVNPTDYLADGGEYKKHLHVYVEQTGIWIQATEEYQKWHDNPGTGCLWIKGIPGSRKSVSDRYSITFTVADSNAGLCRNDSGESRKF